MAPPKWWDEAVAVLGRDPSFIRRESQDRTVEILADAFAARRHAAVEAPTGTGKAIGSLLVAEHNVYRTVISTATRALQEQIRTVDVPRLQGVGLLSGEVVVLQGRARYACGNRLDLALGERGGSGVRHLRALRKALQGSSGLREDLPPVPDLVWAKVCSDADACRGLGCTGGSCAYTAVRDAARAADLVVVNHHVLLADAAIKAGSAVSWGRRSPAADETVRPAVLGPYRNLIVDEAHALESAAEAFGERRVSLRGILALATRIGRVEGGEGARRRLAEVHEEVRAVTRRLPPGALLEPTFGGPVLESAAETAKEAGSAMRGWADSPEQEMRNEMLASQCFSLGDRLLAIDEAMRTGKDDLGPRAPSCSEGVLSSQLVDASGWLRENLFDHVPTVALSGTLAVPGRRDYVTERIGLATPVVELPSAFDLRAQRLVYVTPRASRPGVSAARSTEEDVAELRELLSASAGRALVLFPAVADLKFVHERLCGLDGRLAGTGHLLLAQGVTADSAGGERVLVPPAELARRFTEDTGSVLLATRSFFEGIDVPGESCSLVVIVRFPNLRPDDPLTLARRMLVEARGGRPWPEYQEPAMMVVFKQAAGRAIRRVDDRGVVAVIDPRAGSKSYGRRALLSLAPSDYTDSVEDVRRFLS
jgi:ATP-dependent DNA helicase DinG